jgi:Ni/Co efflux regulator RcnB
MIMKTLVSALVALSLVAGTVASATAAEPFSIKQLDQDQRGGHAG